MPLSSPKRNISDLEYKLRVLLCLDALGMTTQEQLWPFVAQLEMMEYLPFCMFVDELRTSGAIAEAGHALKGALYLTPAGRQQLGLFLAKVPHADRQRIRAAAPGYMAQLSERRQVRAAYEQAPRGWYRAACTVREDDIPTLFLRIHTRDRALAVQAVERFRACAAQLLTLLYTLPFAPAAAPAALSQEEALAAAQPGRPALCAFGGLEHAAAVQLQDGDTRYTLLLLLPGAGQAWGWAQAADAGDLAKRITAVLKEENA